MQKDLGKVLFGCGAAVVAVQLLGAAALADTGIKVDFAMWAGDTAQPGFTELSGALDQPTFSTTVDGYAVNLAGGGFSDAGHAFDLTAAVRPFYRDYYYNDSTTEGDGVALSLGGLTPNTAYDLTVWTYDADNPNPTPTTWDPYNDTTGAGGSVTNVRTPLPTTLTTNNTTLHVTSTTSTLDVFGTTTSGSGGTRLNGFQLVGPGNSTLMSVDLGLPGTPPPAVQSGFTSMTNGVAQNKNDQTIGGYTVHIEGGNGSFNSDPTVVAGIDPSIRALFAGYYHRNSTSGNTEIDVGNVVPNQTYAVKIWSYSADATGTSIDKWLPFPIASMHGSADTITFGATPLPTSLDDYSKTIYLTSTTSTLVIRGTAQAGSAYGMTLTGMQVTPIIFGDVNFDGIVNGLDIAQVSSHWLATRDAVNGGANVAGDANNDGVVNGLDIALIASNWLQSSGGAGSGATVPEPSTSGLMFFGAVLLLYRRSRGSRVS